MIVLLKAYCNTLKHGMVRAQHNAIRELYNKHIHSALGRLVSNASDGNARKRKGTFGEYDTPREYSTFTTN